MIGMVFSCEYGECGLSESWDGHITKILSFGSHYEMRVLSRSSITIIFGKSYCGYFICIPDDEVSCQVPQLKYTKEIVNKLIPTIGEINASTVAYALKAISPIVSREGKQCKKHTKRRKTIQSLKIRRVSKCLPDRSSQPVMII
jgi:hypothetical protein